MPVTTTYDDCTPCCPGSIVNACCPVEGIPSHFTLQLDCYAGFGSLSETILVNMAYNAGSGLWEPSGSFVEPFTQNNPGLYPWNWGLAAICLLGKFHVSVGGYQDDYNPLHPSPNYSYIGYRLLVGNGGNPGGPGTTNGQIWPPYLDYARTLVCDPFSGTGYPSQPVIGIGQAEYSVYV